MTRENRIAAESCEPALVIARVFDAPRDVVFRAWTDPKQIERWWGPSGFTNSIRELDARPGGAIRIDMRAPDGVVYPMSGIYQEIAPPERLVFSSSALDEEGRALFETLDTITFSEQGAKTALRLEARVLRATAQASRYLEGMEAGWNQSLTRLADLVARVSE